MRPPEHLTSTAFSANRYGPHKITVIIVEITLNIFKCNILILNIKQVIKECFLFAMSPRST